jgi:hypothetical protein
MQAVPRANSLNITSNSLNNTSRSLNSPISLRSRDLSTHLESTPSHLSMRDLGGPVRRGGRHGASFLRYQRSHEVFSRSHLKVAQDIVGSRWA